MILTTTADLKKYVSVAQNFQFEDFEPYIQKAVNRFTIKYVGNLHIELENEATGENATVKNEAREHLRNAIANFGMFLAIPYLSVTMDSSGIANLTNENRQPISWGQIKDLRREAVSDAHVSMDLLLTALDAAPDVFVDYTANFRPANRSLLVHNAETFSTYYNIFNSRTVYLALRPTMLQVEDQYLKTMLCGELLEALKESVTGNLQLCKEYLQKAVVAFTVAKVSAQGMFNISEQGLQLNFETYVDTRKTPIDSGKPTEQIEKLATDKLNDGLQYLGFAKDLIEANPTDFDQCNGSPLLGSNETTEGFKPYNTKGILGL